MAADVIDKQRLIVGRSVFDANKRIHFGRCRVAAILVNGNQNAINLELDVTQPVARWDNADSQNLPHPTAGRFGVLVQTDVACERLGFLSCRIARLDIPGCVAIGLEKHCPGVA